MSGKIVAIIGPMYAGKSETLIRMANRHTIAKRRCLIIAHSSDNRYSDGQVLCTHSGISVPALKVEALQSISEETWLSYDVIAIDEGQFFKDIIAFVDRLVKAGKQIIVSALSSDYRMEPFEVVAQLQARSEKIIQLTAICSGCQKSASFTKKITHGGESAIIDVGGVDKYKAVCRNCYAAASNDC